jgi:alpha-galactosidase
VAFDGTRRVLAKRLSNGDVAVALFNQGGSTTTISTTAAAIGKAGTSFTLRDAWTNATTQTTGAISASVPAHGTVVYRVSGGTTAPQLFRLRSESAGRCLDLPQSSTANGTQMVIWDCHTATNQQFSESGQTLRVLGKCLDIPTNAGSGPRVPTLCLDVNEAATANGTAVIVWSCHSAANQRWIRA